MIRYILVIPMAHPSHKRVVSVLLGPGNRFVLCRSGVQDVIGMILDHVRLAAQDRLDPVLLAGREELNGPVHHPVVGERQRRLAEGGRTLGQLVDLASPVEQRVLGMDVQVGASGAHRRLLEHRRRGGRLNQARAESGALCAIEPLGDEAQRPLIAAGEQTVAAGARERWQQAVPRSDDRRGGFTGRGPVGHGRRSAVGNLEVEAGSPGTGKLVRRFTGQQFARAVIRIAYLLIPLLRISAYAQNI